VTRFVTFEPQRKLKDCVGNVVRTVAFNSDPWLHFLCLCIKKVVRAQYNMADVVFCSYRAL